MLECSFSAYELVDLDERILHFFPFPGLIRFVTKKNTKPNKYIVFMASYRWCLSHYSRLYYCKNRSVWVYKFCDLAKNEGKTTIIKRPLQSFPRPADIGKSPDNVNLFFHLFFPLLSFSRRNYYPKLRCRFTTTTRVMGFIEI